jgi:hypothetical protein
MAYIASAVGTASVSRSSTESATLIYDTSRVRSISLVAVSWSIRVVVLARQMKGTVLSTVTTEC